MTALADQSIVINDLLSFLVCHNKKIRKEKLLECISDYYSETTISEAQKILLAALPVKKSTRHGRRVKHPDTLVAIYDCIQLIPEDDLPLFVCKNLDNVPYLSSQEKKALSFRKSESPVKKESEPEIFNDEMNESDYRKEQKQMKLQISEMFSMIKELKDGLQNVANSSSQKPFLRNQIKSSESTTRPSKQKSDTSIHNGTENDKTILPIVSNVESVPVYKYTVSAPSASNLKRKNIKEKIEGSQTHDITGSDKTSELGGLALIQQLIDEDDENSGMDTIEKANDKEDEEYFDEFEVIDRLVEYDYWKERRKRKREA